jgi:hypothetical protein
MSTPSNEHWITNALVVYFHSVTGDLSYFTRNHFFGLAGVETDCDHTEWDFNLFMLGGENLAWPSNSIYGTGAALIVNNPTSDNRFINNYFYQGTGMLDLAINAAYFFPNGGGNPSVSYNDRYETMNYSIIYPAGQVGPLMEQINPMNAAYLTSAQWSTDGTLTADQTMMGADYTAQMVTGDDVNAMIAQFTGSTSITNNLATTDYVRTQMAGQTNLAGNITTNLQFTFGTTRTNTLYFTNGVLKRVSQP